jgi:hypothetical protein
MSFLWSIFGRKKEPHFSSVRSVETVDAPEGRVASVANKDFACDLLSADF